MTQKEVLDELKALIVERLKFDPSRAAEMTLETTLPRGVEGSRYGCRGVTENVVNTSNLA